MDLSAIYCYPRLNVEFPATPLLYVLADLHCGSVFFKYGKPRSEKYYKSEFQRFWLFCVSATQWWVITHLYVCMKVGRCKVFFLRFLYGCLFGWVSWSWKNLNFNFLNLLSSIHSMLIFDCCFQNNCLLVAKKFEYIDLIVLSWEKKKGSWSK